MSRVFNFARRPFQDDRPVYVATVVLLGIGLALLVANLRLFTEYRRQVADTRAEIEALEERQRRADRKAQAREVRRLGLQALGARRGEPRPRQDRRRAALLLDDAARAPRADAAARSRSRASAAPLRCRGRGLAGHAVLRPEPRGRGPDDRRAREGPGARGRRAEERDRGRPGKPGAVSVLSRRALRAAGPGAGDGTPAAAASEGNAAMKLFPAGWNRRLPLALAALVFAAGNVVFFWATVRAPTSGARRSRRGATTSRARSRPGRRRRRGSRPRTERLSGVSEAMEEFYGHRIGTQEETLAGLVADLHAALKEAGIETTQISYATAPVPKLPLTRMRVTLRREERLRALQAAPEDLRDRQALDRRRERRDPARRRAARLRVRADGAGDVLRGPRACVVRPVDEVARASRPAPARGAVPAARSAS